MKNEEQPKKQKDKAGEDVSFSQDLTRDVMILTGLPGSGKSTFAESYIKSGYVRLNKDELREMVNGYNLNYKDEPLIHEMQMTLLGMLLDAGRNVIIDNTHTKTKYVTDLCDFISNRVKDSGYEYIIEIRPIEVTLATAKERNKDRRRVVPEDVIDRMHEQLFNSGLKRKIFYAKEWPVLVN